MTSEEPEIDFKLQRVCVYRRFEGEPGPCPRCGSRLLQKYQTYLLATRRGRQITDAFLTGNDMGWFCPNCPTVVINTAWLDEAFQHKLPHWDIGDQFVVLGTVDLNAIPEEKRHLPLGEEGNSIPLLRFVDAGEEAGGPRRKAEPHKRSARQRKKGKKRRR